MLIKLSKQTREKKTKMHVYAYPLSIRNLNTISKYRSSEKESQIYNHWFSQNHESCAYIAYDVCFFLSELTLTTKYLYFITCISNMPFSTWTS